jgi:hypothetical protein
MRHTAVRVDYEKVVHPARRAILNSCPRLINARSMLDWADVGRNT